MPLPDIFTKEVSNAVISRIQKLSPETLPIWGKMSVSQMLAHCSVSYEYVYEPTKYQKPNMFLKFILKRFVKRYVVNEVGYKRNKSTGPDFIIIRMPDFDVEKLRLINFINRVQKDGIENFDGRISHSFGPLSITEWNNMFYKHINHHLTQFGV